MPDFFYPYFQNLSINLLRKKHMFCRNFVTKREYITYSSIIRGKYNGVVSMKPRVLCVDDQYGIRLLLKEILKCDYDVVAVETGEEALESIRVFEPQVVILDMKLEKTKGTELLKTIKQINCNIGAIMLTGYQDRDLIDEIEQSHPEKIIIKPFEVEQIKSSVKELVASSKDKGLVS